MSQTNYPQQYSPHMANQHGQMQPYQQQYEQPMEMPQQQRQPRGMGIRNDNGLQLETLQDIVEFAKIVHGSDLAPKDFKTPEKIFIAVEMGLELGLPPMAALQNIGVINGRPGIYGSIALGLVMASGKLAAKDEWFEDEHGQRVKKLPKPIKPGCCAVCYTKRSDNGTEETTVFSVEMAVQAGLWGKAGPWTQYPERMLKFRARGFNLADNFPEVLKGVKTTEELEDYPAPHAPQAAVAEVKSTTLAGRLEEGKRKLEAPTPTQPQESTSAPTEKAQEISEAVQPEPEVSADELKAYEERRKVALNLDLQPTGKLKSNVTRARFNQCSTTLEKMIAEKVAENNANIGVRDDLDERVAEEEAEAADSNEPSEEEKQALLDLERQESEQAAIPCGRD